jgi:hypothetical protein
VTDIKLDLARLSSMLNNFSTIKNEFVNAEEFSAQVADTVGHNGLSHVVHDFASAWNIRRGKIIEELEYIDKATVAIRDTMEEIDARLAAEVEKSESTGLFAMMSTNGSNP